MLCLVPVPFIVLAMKGFSKKVRPAFRKRQEELGELNAILQDNISGIREIKAFTREHTEAHRIRSRINNYKDSLLRALRLMATFQPLVEFSSSFGTILLIYFGGRLALNQTLSLEDLVAFFLYLELFYRPVRMLSMAWEHIQEALSGAERVAELLEEEPEVTESANPVSLPKPVRGEITFDSVSFEYVDETPVLRDVSLTIPEGNLAAFVGPTGVGKTTIASLIPRFYDPVEGRVLLDGVDLRNVSLRELRSQISIVLQDVFLFHGTVRENIAFGRVGAGEEEILTASAVANADEFIQELPEGYDTLVGERGVKLSGGQKQRLSIARAVLADKPILILDEATSSVDARTESLIQEALYRLMHGRTTVVIAHRLSTIREADSIYVLKEGRVVEAGGHTDLIESDGEYRRLYEQYRAG
jgi:ATP-binding cassette subfamily B protein/subfamily B ATP-binding cassette protein MsbA